MATNVAAGAAVRLTLRHPFWTEIFYSMTVEETVPGDGVDTAATDGRTLWINKSWWEKLSLEHQVAVTAHELCHKIFLHCTRRGSRDPLVWNYACDYAVNAILKENGFHLPEPHLYDAKYKDWTAERIYAELSKARGKGSPQPGGWGAGDVIDARGTPEETERAETEIKALVERAVSNAKSMGKLPVGIEQGIVDAYRPTKESWFSHLHRYMQSLSTSEYNWARMNRRTLRSHHMFTPMHQSEALGDIAVFIDTSGSCYQAAQQADFCGHMNAILADARPRRVHTFYFDAAVYPGATIEAGELDIQTRPRGGGGTAFAPIFDRLDEDGIVPEVCIILTDLMGSFPQTVPDYPVVWASICDGTAPFGDVIFIE